MKFSFIITNLAGGGAEKVILSLAEGLSQRGHETEVVLLEDRVQHQASAGVNLVVLGKRIKRGWLGKRLMAWRLRRHFAAGSTPDLIVSALPFANEVAILAKLPKHWCRIDNNLGTEIDQLAQGNPAKARRRLARYRHLYGRRPLIAVSAGVANDLRRTIDVQGRVEKISNPFDFAAIRSAARAIEPALPKQSFVLHVGRFNRQKRHDILLDAWTQTNTDRLLVLLVAPTPELQALIDARDLQDRVCIAGFHPNPFPWMAASDLLVLSSDHEGLGNVLIEALACGTRVVSTDCPSGPAEILSGGLARWLVPCRNPEALARAMEAALASGRPSAEEVEGAIAPYAAQQLLDTWESLAKEKGGD